jgi:hypothetical protein
VLALLVLICMRNYMCLLLIARTLEVALKAIIHHGLLEKLML